MYENKIKIEHSVRKAWDKLEGIPLEEIEHFDNFISIYAYLSGMRILLICNYLGLFGDLVFL